MKTCVNQGTEDSYLTLPFVIAQEVLERMKKNSKCIIHSITTSLENDVVKQTIKYHYET